MKGDGVELTINIDLDYIFYKDLIYKEALNLFAIDCTENCDK